MRTNLSDGDTIIINDAVDAAERRRSIRQYEPAAIPESDAAEVRSSGMNRIAAATANAASSASFNDRLVIARNIHTPATDAGIDSTRPRAIAPAKRRAPMA